MRSRSSLTIENEINNMSLNLCEENDGNEYDVIEF